MIIDFITHNHRHLDLNNINPDKIHIDDIAHALGNLCRFAGHTSRFYSVAEHSLILEQVYLDSANAPTLEGQLICLLHDAAEAYLGDIAVPTQALLNIYDYDVPLRNLIFKKFGVDPDPHWGWIRMMDTTLAVVEGHMMIGNKWWAEKYEYYFVQKQMQQIMRHCEHRLSYGFPCIRGYSAHEMRTAYRNRVCYILSCIGAMCDPNFLHE